MNLLEFVSIRKHLLHDIQVVVNVDSSLVQPPLIPQIFRWNLKHRLQRTLCPSLVLLYYLLQCRLDSLLDELLPKIKLALRTC